MSKLLILPPACFFLLALIGVTIGRRRPRLGRWTVRVALALLVIASTGLVGTRALVLFQVHEPLPATGPLPAADAIVVLSGGVERDGREFGGPTVDDRTLRRLRYGAALARRSKLPILVTGGVLAPGVPPVAKLMADVLRDEFGVTPRWVESRSGTTLENATFSGPLLLEAQARRILLVTDAWHLPRAAAAFRAQGLEVIPAPTAFVTAPDFGLYALIPNADALRDSALACHELFGNLVYRVFFL